MRDHVRDERGAVGINLTIFLAFALYAVVQLSRTTLAAQEIDERVESIIVTTPEIAASLTNVPKLDETGVTAANIAVASENLTGHLDEVMASAENIDGTVVTINESASAINGSVHSINASVGSISSDVRTIGASVAGVDDVTRSIRQGVADINGRADVIIDLARQIEGDLSSVLAHVGGPKGGGFGSGGSKTIAGHANAIDCTVLGAECER